VGWKRILSYNGRCRKKKKRRPVGDADQGGERLPFAAETEKKRKMKGGWSCSTQGEKGKEDVIVAARQGGQGRQYWLAQAHEGT